MSEILVFKFGGASVKDAAGIRNLANIARLYSDQKLVVVVSAMDKTTNKLEALTRSYINRDDDTSTLLDEIKSFHSSIMTELFGDKKNPVFDAVSNSFVEIEWLLEDDPHDDYGYIYDQIVSIGEIVSSHIVSAYLNSEGIFNQWMDARSLIQTDNTYREGQVNWEKTKKSVIEKISPVLEEGFVVTQGFIGGTSENYTTTLGREGSDYSAAILASSVGAASVTIWKDVPGVLNADPKLFPDTVKYNQLSYAEALEMTYYGATVIHPKTIKPLQNANIPLFVKPFYAPEESGTVISNIAADNIYAPAIILKNNQLLVSLATKDLSFITEQHLSDIFKAFAKRHIKINLMQSSAISFTVCFDWDEYNGRDILAELEQEYIVKYNSGVQLYTVRHYKNDILESLIGDKTVLVKQLSRQTAQLATK